MRHDVYSSDNAVLWIRSALRERHWMCPVGSSGQTANGTTERKTNEYRQQQEVDHQYQEWIASITKGIQGVCQQQTSL